MEFANLYIGYKSQVAEGSRVETLLSNVSPEVDYTPDQRLVTTLSLGKEPAYTDEETAPVTETPTEPSETEPSDTENPMGTEPSSESDTLPPAKKGCRSALALPSALLLVCAGVLVFGRKKENNA
jgi:hypothetical protein